MVNSPEDEIFEDLVVLSMLIDIFSERGFQVVADKTIAAVATFLVDLTTGDIEHARKAVYRINVVFWLLGKSAAAKKVGQ